MNKILLKDDAHLLQMLGTFDSGHGYALPKDIAEILLSMPKKPVVSANEIDVGTNAGFLQGALDTEFFLQGSTLFFAERAYEMGGLIAYTYLTPLGELTLDCSADVDLTPIKERKLQRREKHLQLLAEHERLARRVIKQLAAPDVGDAKRFIRRGKPDYASAQLQYLEYTGGENEIISRWKAMCDNKTSAALLTETTYADLHVPKFREAKPTGGKGKAFDFAALVAAMLKLDKPQPKLRLEPSAKAAEVLTAEQEVEHDFEPEQTTPPASGSHPFTREREVSALVSQLIKENPTTTSRKGRTQVQQSQRVPEPLNRDLER